MKQNKAGLWQNILFAGLLVGFLDGLAAMLLSKGNPDKIFQYIASSIFGTKAFAGGVPMVVLGVLLHFLIAFIWTILFFIIYTRVSILSKHPLLAGILYGMIIWICMNLIVLPLSRVPASSLTLRGSITSALILIVVIGFPLSFMAKRFYETKA